MLSTVEVRNYPYGEAAAHLIGYVSSVTAEDLEEHPDEGYSSDSVIGKKAGWNLCTRTNSADKAVIP